MTIDIATDEAAAKTTLTGLRQRLDAIVDAKDAAPQRLTRKQFDRLSEADQGAHDDDRLQWFSNLLYINNPAHRELVKTGLGHLRMLAPHAVKSPGIVLTGPPHIGKTSALIRFAREVEEQVRRYNPAFREQGIVPAVYIEMEPKATPKSIASSVLHFFGIPHNFKSATQHELTTQAIDALRRHRTRVLMMDEIQMLKLDGKIGDDAINSLKTFMNDSGAITVFAGVDLTVGLASRAAEQIMARCRVIEMQPMTGTNDDTRGRWLAIVETLGAAMYLVDGEPDHLAPHADPLLALSNGKIGDLRSILSLAMYDAITEREQRGMEVITSDTLHAVGRIGTT